MRLLLVNDTREAGGAERHFWESVRLLRQEHDVTTLTFGSQESAEGKDLVIRESSGEVKKKIQGMFTSLELQHRIKEAVERVDPDIVHIHNVHKYPSAILGALRNRKVVHTIHDYGYVCPTGWSVVQGSLKVCPAGYGIKCLRCLSLGRWIGNGIYHPRKTRLLKDVVSVSVCPSKRLVEYTQKHGFPKPCYVPHFVDTEKWFPEHVEKRKGLVLYVGGLTRQKGVSFLIRALPGILKKADARLEIIGEGPQKHGLQEDIAEMGIKDKVTFLGKLSDEELRKRYSSAACLVVPSVWMEQFGFVGVEAMLCGCPVVGSDIGGIPDWLKDGKTGVLARRADSSSIAEKVLELLQDREKARRLARNGQDLIKKELSPFLWKERIERIYQEA